LHFENKWSKKPVTRGQPGINQGASVGKLSREYYPLTEAAELLDFELEELLHSGACGTLPVYVKPKNWSGVLFNPHDLIEKESGKFLANPPQPITISALAQGRLYGATLEQFDFGDVEVTIKSLQHPPISKQSQSSQFDLDDPVVIRMSDLYVFTKDLLSISPVQESKPKCQKLAVAPPDITSPVKPTEVTTHVDNSQLTFLRIGQVEEITGMSRKTIYPKIKSGDFPKQHKQGGTNISVWVASEVYAYNQTQLTKSRNPKAKI